MKDFDTKTETNTNKPLNPLDIIFRFQEESFNLIDALEKTIGPVLLPPAPSPGTLSDESKEDPEKSALNRALDDAAHSSAQINQRIRNLISRVDTQVV